jgi:hypothetical protein
VTKADLDQAKETVGSSVGPLLPLLDVRLASAHDLHAFSPVLEDLRDALPQPSAVLDGLREDLEDSPRRPPEFRERRDES